MSLRRVRSIRVLVLAPLVLAFAPASLRAQTAIVNGHTVTLVSATPSGAGGNGDSYAGAASTSPGGPCVAFGSLASDLVVGDANGVADVFLREAGVTARVSLAGSGLEADGHSDIWNRVAASTGCRLVAFGSRATNLVPGDTNGLQDVFVHDRDTGLTTRVALPADDPGALRDAGSPSLGEDGRFLAFDTAVNPLLSGSRVYLYDRAAQVLTAIGGSYARRPVVSGDGTVVAFATYTRGSVPGLIYDDGLWLHDRASGLTRELAQLGDSSDDIDLAGWPAISFDGHRVAFASSRPLLPADTNRAYDVYLQDTQTGERVLVSAGPDGLAAGARSPALSRDGRFVAFSSSSPALLPADGSTEGLFVFDAVTRRVDLVVSTSGAWMVPTAFTPDARHLALFTNANWVSTDTRTDSADTYLVSLDSDGDEVPDTWERLFGMNPYAADSSGDADEDGRTNLEEFLDGTHPRGLFTRLLAEGATGFFTTTVSLANPNYLPVAAVVSFLPSVTSTAPPVRRIVELGVGFGEGASMAIDVGSLAGMQAAEFSTLVESDHPIAVERLMAWDSRSFGGHTETAVAEPSTTWHFAEGATHSGFDLFYLLQNPGPTIADVDVRYLLPPPAAPLVKNYRVSPHSRRTIWVNYEDPRLASTDVSAAITSANSQPILAERAMYLGHRGLMFAAGHAATGVKAPATSWVIAEGATGPFFDLFLLLSNPGETTAEVQLRYLLPDGRTIDCVHTVAPRSRTTVWVDYEAPELADTAVSTLVTSLNDVPFVAERAMWWPGPAPANWLEAHAAPASRTLARRWVLPPSAVMPSGANDFLLLANPGDTAGTARLTLSATNLGVERSYALPARSRTNVWVNVEFPGVIKQPVMASVEANVPIVVERAEYWQAEGVPWEGGTATRATPLPLELHGEDTFVQETGASHRASFDGVAPGTYPPPLLLDSGAVRVDLTTADVALVRAAGTEGSRLATSFLSTSATAFGNNVVITLPAGTTAAGVWLESAGPLTVTATDVEGGGFSRLLWWQTALPHFIGFAGGPAIRSIRISAPPSETVGDVNVGDIVYAKP